MPSRPLPTADVGQGAKRLAWFRLFGVVLGVSGIVVGSVFAIGQLNGRSGATEPEGAVRTLLQSIADGDAIGFAHSLVPAERDLLLEEAAPVYEQLRRLGAVRRGAKLRNVDGYEATLTGLRLGTREDSGVVAEVTLEAGTLSTSVDVLRLPFASVLRDSCGRVLGRTGNRLRKVDLAKSFRQRPVIAVRSGGRWRVSLIRTAVGARRGPTSDAPVAPEGAASPELAVRNWFAAVSRLDAERTLAVLAPGEAGAFQGNPEWFLPAIQDVLSGVDGQYTFEFPGLVLDASMQGDRSVVRVHRFSAAFTLSQPDSPALRVEVLNGCATVQLDADTHRRCGRDTVNLLDDLGIPVTSADLDRVAPTSLSAGGSRPSPGLAIVAVREGGRWYVSPGRTVLRATQDQLETLSPAQFRTSVKALSKLITGTAWSGGVFFEF